MKDLIKYKGRKLTTDEFAIANNLKYKKIEQLEKLEFEVEGDDYLCLKWGGFKGGDYTNNPKARELLDELFKIGVSFSAIMQKNTERQKEILCELVDVTNGYIINDWSGEYFTKEQAKKYILEYNQ